MRLSHPRRSAVVVLPLALLLILPLGVIALVSADDLESTPLGRVLVSRSRPHPVSVAASDLFARQQKELADLQLRIDRAPTTEEALALEREYQAVKIRAERDFLQLQLDHARSIGNDVGVAELEEAVTTLEAQLARNARPDDLEDLTLDR